MTRIEAKATDYVLDNYGTCDRLTEKRNNCYWGTDNRGNENGCLKVGWKGRGCPHWHPVAGAELQDLIERHMA